MMPYTLLIEPHYLPSVACFSKIYQAEALLLEVYGRYQKKTFQSRCYLATTQGLQKLSIPVQYHTTRGHYCNAKIDYTMPWPLKHMRAIRATYGKTPYYGTLEDLLFPILRRKPTFLLDVTLPMIMACCTFLRLDKVITQTSSYCTQAAPDRVDWRGRLRPEKDGEDISNSPNVSVLHCLAKQGPYAHHLFTNPVD